MKHLLLSVAILLTVCVETGLAAPPSLRAEKTLPLDGEVFLVEGRTAFVIPAKASDSNGPKGWVWYAPTLPNLPGEAERWMFERFVDAGIAIAGIDVGESYGSPAGNRLYTAFYREMTVARGYAPRPVLLARSRGGLMTLSWAAEHPDTVAAFAGIYPVSNLASYPGVARAAGAYEMTAEELGLRLTEFNPIDRLAALAKNGVPLFAIHGDVDKVVPLEANSGLVKERYTALGASMRLIVPNGQGHNMWPGFFQNQELVDFVIRHGRSAPRTHVGATGDVPSRYDVVWDSPSEDASGSMPLGNGDIGLNAWVEPTGELVFYISKTDTWGDNGRLLKVGRVRVTLDPAPPTRPFRQTLRLHEGTIEVLYGEQNQRTNLRLWVDANHPVVHVTAEAATPVSATATIELWRTEPHALPSVEVSDVLKGFPGTDQSAGTTIVEPDTVLEDRPGHIGWYHHNRKSIGPAITARIQGLDGFEREDPLLGRTFGALITAERGERIDDRRLQSPRATSHRFSIYVLTRHPATPGEWLDGMDGTVATVNERSFNERRREHELWWAGFWDRSWIHVTAGQGRTPLRSVPPDDHPARIGVNGAIVAAETLEDETLVVGRAYALQRYITACAGRGRYPIKFNGSIFTVPHPDGPGGADYRRWGPGYWWQNTRLPYMSLCTSGDFDMMQALFRMYADDLMPLNRYRTRVQCGHDGAFIPECIYFWGDVFSETYGWTPMDQRGEDRLQASRWHKWEWVSGPELVFMMLDYYDHTSDEAFLRERLLPTAREILTFFDQHYQVNQAGKLVMRPSQACETWWECTNPMPELAGLHAVTARLLALPRESTTAGLRAFWTSFQRKLPGLPVREVEGAQALAPAESFAEKRNIESPELYAVFPFRLVAFEKENAPSGLAALKHRWDRGNTGWRQDDVFMAYLGLSDDARTYLVGRARNHDKGSRFPAFWGPNYDWVPDQDHGGILMKALQAMLLQTEGRKIFLLPAWPKDWNVSFRLHAPYRTVVQCEFRNGKVTELSVAPIERRADIVLPRDLDARG